MRVKLWWQLSIGALVAISMSACAISASLDDHPPPLSSCRLDVAFVAQATPVVPTAIVVEAVVTREGGLEGPVDLTWSVRGIDDEEIAFEPRDVDNQRIAFEAIDPGPYDVSLNGDVGDETCEGTTATLNAIPPDANQAYYRLRLIPAPGQPAPVQDQVIRMWGGTDWEMGTVAMESGAEVTGMITTADLTPISAYVRASRVGGFGASAVETFANEQGQFSARLPIASYDVLVVPDDDAIAPAAFTNVPFSQLSLSLPPGVSVQGAVSDDAGPVAGARVALSVGDIPSTLATTDAAGEFTVAVQPGGPARVTVTPPDDSGLPALLLGAEHGLDIIAGGGPIAVAYASGLTSRTVALPVVTSDGATPLPGARVTWASRSGVEDPLQQAGTVTVSGGAPLPAVGTVRITQVADAGGALPALRLPEAEYDVVIAPDPVASGDQAPAVVRVDLRTGQPTPAVLQLAPPVTLSGVVHSESGGSVGGARVIATPTGLLASLARAGASVIADPDGQFSVDVVAGGDYAVEVISSDVRDSRGRWTLPTLPPGQALDLGTILLAPALRLSGRVTIPGVPGGARGVTLRLLCQSCQGVEAEWPHAEAVTDASGRFELAVPDPG